MKTFNRDPKNFSYVSMKQKDQLIENIREKIHSRLRKSLSKMMLKFLSSLKCFDFTNIFKHQNPPN